MTISRVDVTGTVRGRIGYLSGFVIPLTFVHAAFKYQSGAGGREPIMIFIWDETYVQCIRGFHPWGKHWWCVLDPPKKHLNGEISRHFHVFSRRFHHCQIVFNLSFRFDNSHPSCIKKNRSIWYAVPTSVFISKTSFDQMITDETTSNHECLPKAKLMISNGDIHILTLLYCLRNLA